MEFLDNMYHTGDHLCLKYYRKRLSYNFQHIYLCLLWFSLMEVNVLYVITNNNFYLTKFFLLYSTTELIFHEHTPPHTHTHLGRYNCSGVNVSGNHSDISVFTVCSHNIFISWALILLPCSPFIYLTISPGHYHSYTRHRQYLNIYGSSIRPVLGTWEVLNTYLLDK